MSFGTKVRELLDERGHDAAWLAKQTQIAKSTISNWMTNANAVPKPSSVAAVAQALDVPIEELAPAAGYTMMPSADNGNRARRLAALSETSPRVARVALRIADLDVRRQDEVLSMLEGYFLIRRRQSPEESG